MEWSSCLSGFGQSAGRKREIDLRSKRTYQMDEGWRVFDPNPTQPTFTLPPGAVDAHCHVFGPGDRFPYAEQRKYTPCDAPKEKLQELREFLGFERNVIVQASCHGTGNAALVDALEQSEGRARGVAFVASDISDTELDELHAAGVRGVRFNFVKRLVDSSPRESLLDIADRIQRLGWHIVIYFEAQDLSDLYEFFAGLPTTGVVDHIGLPDVTGCGAGWGWCAVSRRSRGGVSGSSARGAPGPVARGR